MRKLLLTTAAVAAAIGLAGCGKKEPVPETPNTFTDTRDGQTYKTVKIGKQTWMAQNINYKTNSSWCYNDDTSYCNKYGRLYNWKTAQTACPAKYHLPSREEWDQLAKSVGGRKSDHYNSWHHWLDAGKKLKSTSGWYNNGNGTDNVGFSALPGGIRYSDGDFNDAGRSGFWWMATVRNSGSDYNRFVYYYDDYVYEGNYNKSYGFSVRCVADRP